ncbi:Plasmid-related protein [Halomonas casei]
MTTEEYMLQEYGPLMSLGDIANLLGRSPDGVRVALYSDTDVSRKLKPTMLRVGRRVYFRTLQVKDALTLEGDSSDQAVVRSV